jgi:gamma-D-glutamyl-L-lysine dipeptidyl-peptidase
MTEPASFCATSRSAVRRGPSTFVLLGIALLVAAGGCAAQRADGGGAGGRVEVAAPRAAVPSSAPAIPATATPAAAIPAPVQTALESVRQQYAPDRRVARFDVEAAWHGDTLVVAGETTSSAAHAAFVRALAGHDVAFINRIMVLPDAALGDAVWALANNSVANLRTTPGHSAELSTQVLLGTPLRVLKRQDGFYLVQSPDGYISWVDGGGIHRVTEQAIQSHRAAQKIIYTRTSGAALAAPQPDAEPVADLVLGALLEVDAAAAGGYYRARMPDGRTAYVARDEAAPYDTWLARRDATASSRDALESSLVATARSLMGAPYLWGGTSAKGMDCSGFTKTIYHMNGMILPRDASQQVHVGTLVDDVGAFDRLRAGDLLFFGRPAAGGAPERVVHVGMWLGGGRFIHASGRVRVDSMDPAAADYDAYNRGRYLRTMRVLGGSTGFRLLRQDGLYSF